MSNEYEDWHVKLFEADEEKPEKPKMQPFSLFGMTEKQEKAIRDLAVQVGFKTLRGFNKWIAAAMINYYDLIKIASP